jgi:hypothetical protein
MLARALWQNKNTNQNEASENGRGDRAAQGEPTIADRLVEEIADGGAQGPRQDEGDPE